MLDEYLGLVQWKILDGCLVDVLFLVLSLSLFCIMQTIKLHSICNKYIIQIYDLLCTPLEAQRAEALPIGNAGCALVFSRDFSVHEYFGFNS